MKLILLKPASFSPDGVRPLSFKAGERLEVSDGIGKAWVAMGVAKALTDQELAALKQAQDNEAKAAVHTPPLTPPDLVTRPAATPEVARTHVVPEVPAGDPMIVAVSHPVLRVDPAAPPPGPVPASAAGVVVPFTLPATSTVPARKEPAAKVAPGSQPIAALAEPTPTPEVADATPAPDQVPAADRDTTPRTRKAARSARK